jgi:IclR family KDG regulon transcriptional repressor
VSSNVQSVTRAFCLLELLGAGDDDSLSVSELARRSALPIGTVHRLLNTLIQLGYVEKDLETHRYSLGVRVLSLRGSVASRLRLGEQAMPIMKALMRKVDETVHLAVMSEGEVLYIDRVESFRTQNMYTQIGKRGPVHCTALGKVMLAYLPQAVVDVILDHKGMTRYSATTITDRAVFAQELAGIRQRGYAIDDRESDETVRCVAGPIRNHAGDVIAAISISGPAIRMRPERDPELSEAVCWAALRISAGLGYLQE